MVSVATCSPDQRLPIVVERFDATDSGPVLGESDDSLAPGGGVACQVLEATVPWMPGPTAPGPEAWIAAIDNDGAKLRYPTYEFTADLRCTAGPLAAIRAIRAEAEHLLGASDRSRIADRAQRWSDARQAQRKKNEDEVLTKAKNAPVDPTWVSYQLAQALDDNCILMDDTMPSPRLASFLSMGRPGSTPMPHRARSPRRSHSPASANCSSPSLTPGCR